MAPQQLWGSFLSYYISALPFAAAQEVFPKRECGLPHMGLVLVQGVEWGQKMKLKGRGRAENRRQRLIFKKPNLTA